MRGANRNGQIRKYLAFPSGIVLQQCKNETAKSLLGARTKQKIGLNTSRDSVKSSSLDSDSNVANR